MAWSPVSPVSPNPVELCSRRAIGRDAVRLEEILFMRPIRKVPLLLCLRPPAQKPLLPFSFLRLLLLVGLRRHWWLPSLAPQCPNPGLKPKLKPPVQVPSKQHFVLLQPRLRSQPHQLEAYWDVFQLASFFLDASSYCNLWLPFCSSLSKGSGNL